MKMYRSPLLQFHDSDIVEFLLRLATTTTLKEQLLLYAILPTFKLLA